LGAHIESIPDRTPIDVWFQDEALIGQKNGIVRQLARTGIRPRQEAGQRCENAYLFVAICEAWINLMELPDTITSIGMWEWAHVDRSG